eukprot:Skav228182  [mRNA]  locus=scaffold3933:253507:261186:+ [translate_table: standard]
MSSALDPRDGFLDTSQVVREAAAATRKSSSCVLVLLGWSPVAVGGELVMLSQVAAWNEAAVQSHSEGPVILEAFVAKKLRPHQREGDGPGQIATSLGSAVGGAVQQFGAQGQASLQAVIVCPSSLCANWRAEVKKWLGEKRLKPTVVESGKEKHGSIQLVIPGTIPGTWRAAAPRKTELQIREFRDFGSRKLLIVSYDQLLGGRAICKFGLMVGRGLARSEVLEDPAQHQPVASHIRQVPPADAIGFAAGSASLSAAWPEDARERPPRRRWGRCNANVASCPDLFARGQMSMAPKAAAQVVQRAREPLASLEEKALGQQVTRERLGR